jgi:hypothetical protein
MVLTTSCRADRGHLSQGSVHSSLSDRTCDEAPESVGADCQYSDLNVVDTHTKVQCRHRLKRSQDICECQCEVLPAYYALQLLTLGYPPS